MRSDSLSQLPKGIHIGTEESARIWSQKVVLSMPLMRFTFMLSSWDYMQNERRPFDGKKHNFSMEMKRWGNINIDAFPDRKTYPIIQKYVFAALIAKTDIDLLAIDRGDISRENEVSELMRTLCEYTNGGFYLMNDKMELVPDYFDGSSAFLDFIH